MKRVSLLFLGSTGAGPVYSLEMAKALANMGKCHLQCVISRQVTNLGDWEKAFSDSDVELVVVDTYKHNKFSFAVSLLSYWKVNRIVNTIKHFKPDYLYVPFLLTWDFLIYPRIHDYMKVIATLHDPHPHDESNNPLINWLQRQNKKAYKYVSDVIVLNNRDAQYVKENFCPNVHVIPHASFSYYVNNIQIEKKIKNTIGFFGRIEPYKGLDLLVDAFHELDNKYKMIIAGSGKIDNLTYEKIKNNERIKLINRYIRDEEFTGLINNVDFVVLPYKRASQSGVIPLVFAHGKTVVVTNVGALSEQVPEGTGMIAEPNVTSLVQAIKGMYDNKDNVFSYGYNAKVYADEELTWDSSANKVLRIVYQDKINDEIQ